MCLVNGASLCGEHDYYTVGCGTGRVEATGTSSPAPSGANRQTPALTPGAAIDSSSTNALSGMKEDIETESYDAYLRLGGGSMSLSMLSAAAKDCAGSILDVAGETSGHRRSRQPLSQTWRSSSRTTAL